MREQVTSPTAARRRVALHGLNASERGLPQPDGGSEVDAPEQAMEHELGRRIGAGPRPRVVVWTGERNERTDRRGSAWSRAALVTPAAA